MIQLLQGYRAAVSGDRTRCGALRQGWRSKRKLLSQLLTRFDSVESRLSALEHRVGTGPDVGTSTRRSRRFAATRVRHRRPDFEHAAALRDREKQMLREKASRQKKWATAHMDLPSLSAEVERLRDLLRQHGIGPQDGVA